MNDDDRILRARQAAIERARELGREHAAAGTFEPRRVFPSTRDAYVKGYVEAGGAVPQEATR